MKGKSVGKVKKEAERRAAAELLKQVKRKRKRKRKTIN